MKKSISLEELKALAREVLEKNPVADKVYATRNGQVFLPHALNAAQMHARDEGGDKPLKIYTITREEALSEEGALNETLDGDGDGKDGLTAVDDPDEGIREMIAQAVGLQVVKKAGNFYSFGEIRIGQGLKQAVATLKENATIQQSIADGIAKVNVQ